MTRARWAVLGGIAALVAALMWGGPYVRSRDGVRASSPEHPVVGTAGRAIVPEPEDTPGTLHDLETMTGAVDPHALIGERVDFHVRVAGVENPASLWVGTRDNRVLVMLGRDSAPVNVGQTARVIGTIEKIPLGQAHQDEEVYIRAESVTPE